MYGLPSKAAEMEKPISDVDQDIPAYFIFAEIEMHITIFTIRKEKAGLLLTTKAR